jgi:hypothetical protein
MSISVQIDIPNAANVLRYYDSFEVQKSTAGVPFSDAASLTGPYALGATIVGTSTAFPHLEGCTLNLDVTGVGVSHTFVGPGPMTITNVLRELKDLPLVSAIGSLGHLKLITQAQGGDAHLGILDGSANLELGFTVGQVVYGLDQNVDLLSGVTKYTFVDHTYPSVVGWYRIRYVNSMTEKTDTWQDWFVGPGSTAIDPENLITGNVSLSALDGKVIAGVEVVFVNCFSPSVEDLYFVAGANMIVKTDAVGKASVSLVRGSLVDVVVEGSSVVRRIRVPVAGDFFNVLDPDIQVGDVFDIKEPDLPAAVRHS